MMMLGGLLLPLLLLFPTCSVMCDVSVIRVAAHDFEERYGSIAGLRRYLMLAKYFSVCSKL